jgi:hypothetical protein
MSWRVDRDRNNNHSGSDDTVRAWCIDDIVVKSFWRLADSETGLEGSGRGKFGCD